MIEAVNRLAARIIFMGGWTVGPARKVETLRRILETPKPKFNRRVRSSGGYLLRKELLLIS
jgi:hypothetical protein